MENWANRKTLILGRSEMKRVIGWREPIEAFQVSFSKGKLCGVG